MKRWIFTLLILLLSDLSFASVRENQYIFIGGLNNEVMPHYFSAARNILREEGAEDVHTIMPSSFRTVLENALILNGALRGLYSRGDGKPLILIAHSKGGLELFHALLREREFFSTGIVKKAVFVNTPFGGSPYMRVSLEEMERSPYVLTPYYQALLRAMRSLQTEIITRDISETLQKISREDVKILQEKFFYIRTAQEPSKVHSSLKKSARYLLNKGSNDGLIPLASQRLPGIGKDLLILNATDHTDLFVRESSKHKDILREILLSL